jgi:hypothetical protein
LSSGRIDIVGDCCVDVGLACAPQVGGELLEVGRRVFEVLVDLVEERLVGEGWFLLVAAPDDDRGRCQQGV